MTKQINLFLFFMVASIFMIFGVNISFFLFFSLVSYSLKNTNLKIFKINNKIKFFALLFGLGALLSTISNYQNVNLFNSSLRVLPNYIYWVLMILFFSSFQNKFKINQYLAFKSISIGIIVIIFYVLFFQDIVSNKLFLKKFLLNNFSFLLICFVPYLIFYLKHKYSFTISFLTLSLILLLMLTLERRAGFGLVALGGFASLYHNLIKKITILKIIKSIALISLTAIFLQINPIKKSILNISPRVHSILYDDVSNLNTDRSQLVRKAMIEKGIKLLNSNIFFGVGLNNFNKSEVKISGNFEGSEFVINKNIFKKISSHNSYINIFAEGGLFLGIPFMLIILFIIKNFIHYYNRLNEYDLIIFISFSFMLIHLFFINAIVNSVAWLNICLALTTIIQKKNKL